jgi:hypothetical protein
MKSKKIFYLILFILLPTLNFAQAQIKFLNDKANFGKVKQGRILNVEFRFVNTGNEALIIDHMIQGCGCVVSNYPLQGIMPGDTASIFSKMVTDGKTGKQKKRIRVFSNASNSPNDLRINCYIKKD